MSLNYSRRLAGSSLFATALALLIVTPFAGAQPPSSTEQAAAAQAITPAGSQPEAISDQDIADAIEDRWLADGILDLNRIDITVDEGIAQIDGRAASLLEKQRAARIAEAVKGVRAVSNQLQVEPGAAVDDDVIEKRITTGLMFDLALADSNLDVSVQDGVVKLTGIVQSWPERQSAERVAEGVRGVLAVDNAIEVRYPEQRSDAEIRADVEERLRWDIRLSTVPLMVAVDDGVVQLSGTVASPSQKRWARWKSWVNGVKDVNAEAVIVSPWITADDWRAEREPIRDDSTIRDALTDALLYDPRVSTFNVITEVEEGWVTLRGSVPALRAKQAAERVARHTVGVAGVTNRIKVRPEQGVDDADLASRILDALEANPYTEATDTTVRVHDGQVTLTGTADTRFEKREAARVAAGVLGVTDVRNAIELIPIDPTWQDTWETDTSIPIVTTRSDANILDEVQDQLFWSPFVDSDAIDVGVAGGIVTLEGTVDSWWEYNAAEANAFDAGVTTVINDLEVD
jgi:osmotically-inducible protein OsmY